MDRQPTDGDVLAEDTPRTSPRTDGRGRGALPEPTTADRPAVREPFSSTTDGGG
jgi:hypothetical protein